MKTHVARRGHVTTILVGALVLTWAALNGDFAGAHSAIAQQPVHDELIRVGGFSAAEVAQFDAGQVIARVAAGDNAQEVAVLGAVRIRAPKENTLAYFNQFMSFEDGAVTLLCQPLLRWIAGALCRRRGTAGGWPTRKLSSVFQSLAR